MTVRRAPAVIVAALLALAVSPAFSFAVARADNLDPGLAARVLALAPDHVSDADVRETLAPFGAPRIVAIEGSVAFVSMRPFAEFLVAMGYPEDRLRDPRDGSYSRNSFGDSERLAGELAWYYEHDGMMPMLIGHSQGGMLAIRTLYELAGAFHDAIPVVDPLTGQSLSAAANASESASSAAATSRVRAAKNATSFP